MRDNNRTPTDVCGEAMDLQFSSLVGYFTKTKAFIVYFTCFNEVFTINGVYIIHKNAVLLNGA